MARRRQSGPGFGQPRGDVVERLPGNGAILHQVLAASEFKLEGAHGGQAFRHQGAGLGDLLGPTAGFQLGQDGDGLIVPGPRQVELIPVGTVVQTCQQPTGGSPVSLLHPYLGQAAADPKTQIHLADIDIAVEYQVALDALPVSTASPAQHSSEQNHHQHRHK